MAAALFQLGAQPADIVRSTSEDSAPHAEVGGDPAVAGVIARL